eukprot:TRINITY_DN1909_c0_g1_i1.p1 TRINITY_DN1909_c0_g1~~TRINITY_DN1909_c0_g1_i1.p1  ORF type:complete len:448 (-),score=116.86 TRINITY_DN1909_c0_g1_i1:148-1491(-)
MDLLEKGTLRLFDLQYFILDEADEMLNMGFRDSIEIVMGYFDRENNKIQTLLYSATIPQWVKQMASQYLQENYIIVDLIGNSKVQTSKGVEHFAITSTRQGRLEALADVVGVYSAGGKVMVFCDTKVSANNIGLSSSISASCQVLHGDISQDQREISLGSFRDGVFNILVCTDVAARGLDIEDVDLVIQCAPPKDPEQYIHRSGRTGRAGKSGISITFYTSREENQLKYIEKKAGLTFQRIGMPQATDIYKVAAETALKEMKEISEDVIPHFLPYAKKLMKKHDDAETAVAYAFAKMCGYTEEVKGRSLLSSIAGFTAVHVVGGDRIHSKGYALNLVSQEIQKQSNDRVNFKEIRLTTDGGALVEVPTKYAEMVIDNQNSDRWDFSIPSELPELQPEPDNGRGRGGRGGRGRRGGRGGRGGRYGGRNSNGRGGGRNGYRGRGRGRRY